MKNFNIWFNSGLSTLPVFVSKLINDLRDMQRDFSASFTISSRTPLNTLFCSKFNDENISGFKRILEPDIKDDMEYLEFCLDFCQKNCITHFVAYKKAEFLCGYRDKFKELGVEFISDADNKLFNSKIQSTDFFNNLAKKYPKLNIAYVPYFEFESTTEFENKYPLFVNSFREYAYEFGYDENNSAEFAVKPDVSINAQGFRHIVEPDKIHGISDIYSYGISTECTYESILDTMRKTDNLRKSICTPFFKGNEWSIDCLKINNSVLAIPRRKGGRFTYIEYPEKLVEFAKTVAKHSDLQGMYNIQVNIFEIDGKMKIYPLEINTRMAGGAYKSCEKTYLAGYFARKILHDTISDEELEKHIRSLEPYTLVDVETSYILESADDYTAVLI